MPGPERSMGRGNDRASEMASQCFPERPAGRERDAPAAAFAEGTTLQKSVRSMRSGRNVRSSGRGDGGLS